MQPGAHAEAGRTARLLSTKLRRLRKSWSKTAVPCSVGTCLLRALAGRWGGAACAI